MPTDDILTVRVLYARPERGAALAVRMELPR
jgi:hypothetical protein